MQPFNTILSANTLRATLEAVEETPNFDPHHPGLAEFKRALLDQILMLRAQSPGDLRLEAHT